MTYTDMFALMIVSGVLMLPFIIMVSICTGFTWIVLKSIFE